MAGPMKWADYGAICRERGSVAKEVFACTTMPAREGPPPKDLLDAHLAYQIKLEGEGALFLAGPLSDAAGDVMSGSGLIVYRAETLAEAQALADADPMHSAGQRKYTMQAWRLNEGAPLPGLRFSDRSFNLD